MNTIITICGILLLVLCGIAFISGPFLIGKPRGTFTGGSYIWALLQIGPTVVVIGRVFGWW